MIRKFKAIKGKYIEKIYGQDRLAYAMSDNEDFYDLIAWSERGGYQGAVIYFYDFETGDVYQPFEKKKNVVYSIMMKTLLFYIDISREKCRKPLRS